MIRTIIVDDEKAVHSIISYFIKKDKMPIEIVGIAERGDKAIDLIKEKKPQLVFLDIQMPIMDGFEVMEKIKDTNFIIITAFESFKYAQRALRLGAKDIILKPIEYKQLIESISRVIGWKFTTNDIVNDLLQYIHTYYNQKLSLTQLAQIFYMTPDYISRIFKSNMNMSIVTYIHKVRIEKAMELLKESNSSVKEVSEVIGYDNINNFYKYFKLYANMTPAVFVQKSGRNI